MSAAARVFMAIVTIAAGKGGVGKTTTTLALGAGLHELGRRPILLDVDPQAKSTKAGGVTPGRRVHGGATRGTPRARRSRYENRTEEEVATSLIARGAKRRRYK
jgi:cellulose biosynthesis protein BcsQ